MQTWPPSDADPLLQAIQEDPQNDEPRLIYADWLEERGDPQAELIRVQCLSAEERTGETSAAEVALVKQQKAQWLSRLQAVGVQDVVVHRGFIEKVKLSGAAVLSQPWLLFRLAPAVRGLMWRNFPDRQAVESLTRMFAWPFFGALTGLDLSQNNLDGSAIEALNRTATLKNLTALHLSGNRLGGHGVHVLAQSSFVRNLTTLSLAQNELSAKGFRDIANSPCLGRLETLMLDDNAGGDGGVSGFAGSSSMGSLRTLSIAGNEITDEGVRSLANARSLTNLTSLNLSRNPLGPVGAARLAQSSNFSRLTTLTMRDCELGPDGARALASSVHFRGLRSLDLYGNDIRGGAIAVAGSKTLGQLESLELGANDIDASGARAFAESPYLTGLKALKLTLNPLGPAAALRERFGKALVCTE